MAEEKLIFNLRVVTGDSAEEINTVEDALAGIDQSLKEINGNDMQGIENAFKDLNDVTEKNALSFAELGDAATKYMNLAAKAGKESPVGKEALKRAAELKREEEAITAELTRMVQGGKAANDALEIGTGVVAGYTAFQSVTALAGVESEKLMETLTKLQAAQGALAAIQQLKISLDKNGVIMQKVQLVQSKLQVASLKAQAVAQKVLNKTTSTGTKVTKGFGKALVATGIGALVAILGLIVANWDKVNKKVSEFIDSVPFLKTIRDTFSEISDKIGSIGNLLNSVGSAISAFFSGDDVAEAFNEALESGKEIILLEEKLEKVTGERQKKVDATLRVLEAQGGKEDEIYKIKINQLKAERDILKALKAKGELDDEQIERLQEVNLQMFELKKQEENRLLAIEKEKDSKLKDQRDKANAERLKQEQDAAKERERLEALRLEEQRKLEDLEIQMIEDANVRKLAELRLQNKRELEELTKKFGAESELVLAAKNKQRADEQALLDEFKAEDDAKLEAQRLIDAEKEAERQEFLKQQQLDLLEEKRLRAEEEAQIEQDLKDAKIFAQQETLNALSVIGDTVIKDEKKREAFQKKIAAVQLAIDTAKAISSTIAGATAAAAAGGPAAPFLLAGYIASGLATVFANFKQAQSLIGGAGSSAASSAGGGGVSAGDITQDIRSGGVSNPNGTNIEPLINGDSETMKVAVLESDITGTQERIEQVNVRSTVG